MYDSANDIYWWGKNFKRDGSDYDPSYNPPSLSKVVAVLKRNFSSNTLFEVVITGKVYKSKTKIAGVPNTVYLDDLSIWAGRPGRSLEYKWMKLFNLTEEPTHITYMAFRPLT